MHVAARSPGQSLEDGCMDQKQMFNFMRLYSNVMIINYDTTCTLLLLERCIESLVVILKYKLFNGSQLVSNIFKKLKQVLFSSLHQVTV